jgi:hypothetical protein
MLSYAHNSLQSLYSSLNLNRPRQVKVASLPGKQHTYTFINQCECEGIFTVGSVTKTKERPAAFEYDSVTTRTVVIYNSHPKNNPNSSRNHATDTSSMAAFRDGSYARLYCTTIPPNVRVGSTRDRSRCCRFEQGYIPVVSITAATRTRLARLSSSTRRATPPQTAAHSLKVVSGQRRRRRRRYKLE